MSGVTVLNPFDVLMELCEEYGKLQSVRQDEELTLKERMKMETITYERCSNYGVFVFLYNNIFEEWHVNLNKVPQKYKKLLANTKETFKIKANS